MHKHSFMCANIHKHMYVCMYVHTLSKCKKMFKKMVLKTSIVGLVVHLQVTVAKS